MVFLIFLVTILFTKNKEWFLKNDKISNVITLKHASK